MSYVHKIEYYLAKKKEMKYWYMLQHGPWKHANSKKPFSKDDILHGLIYKKCLE